MYLADRTKLLHM